LRRDCNDRYYQITPAYGDRNREHTSQVVVQGATLIVRIVGAMFVLSTIMVGVMMVDVSDRAGPGEVSSNVLHVLEGVLDMGADQRHNARRLSQKQKPEEERTKTPEPSR